MTGHTEDEIASQPDCWRRAVAAVPETALPRHGERVAMIGRGTDRSSSRPDLLAPRRSSH